MYIALLFVVFAAGALFGYLIRNRLESIRAFDGKLIVSDTIDGKKTFSLELDIDPWDIDTRASVTFKITHPPSQK